MTKIIITNILGLSTLLLGLYFVFLYTINLGKNGNPLILLPAIILIIVGLTLLIKARKAIKTLMAKNAKAKTPPQEIVITKKKSLLERNNEIASEWEKTNEQRDRLHMLQLAAPDENKP